MGRMDERSRAFRHRTGMRRRDCEMAVTIACIETDRPGRLVYLRRDQHEENDIQDV